jgi:hypothetical protein
LAAQGGINQQFAQGVFISYRNITEQRQIVELLKTKIVKIEKMRMSFVKKLDTINALPQAILKKAFRKEL